MNIWLALVEESNFHKIELILLFYNISKTDLAHQKHRYDKFDLLDYYSEK